VTSLQAELVVLEKWGADPQARALRQIILELTSLEREEHEEVLGLRAAAHECGYSEDHLGRLIRNGTLKNYGCKGAPRLRRGDLPRRSVGLLGQVPTRSIGDSKAAIARAITRPEGGDH